MKVVADTSDCRLELGNNGIILSISDETGKHLGHLRIGQATVEWRKGRVRAGNGKKIRLKQLLDLLDRADGSDDVKSPRATRKAKQA